MPAAISGPALGAEGADSPDKQQLLLLFLRGVLEFAGSYPLEPQAPLDADHLLALAAAAAAAKRGETGETLDRGKAGLPASRLTDQHHPLGLRAQLSRAHRTVSLDATKHRLSILRQMLNSFGSRVYLPFNSHRLQRLGEQALKNFDDDCLTAVHRFWMSHQTEKLALQQVMEREGEIASRIRDLTAMLAVFRQFSIQVESESHGNVRCRRLDPSSKLFKRCERAFQRLTSPECRNSYAILDVYHLQNRVLMDRFDKLAQETKATDADVKGLFRTIYRSAPQDAAPSGHPSLKQALARISCYGWSSGASHDHDMQNMVFPFWCERVVHFDFGPQLPPRLRFTTEIQCTDRPSEVSPLLPHLAETPPSLHPAVPSPHPERGGLVVVLNRVLAGKPLTRAQSADGEEDDVVFEVFPSVHVEADKSYEIMDMRRVLPEFVFILEPIDLRLGLPLLSSKHWQNPNDPIDFESEQLIRSKFASSLPNKLRRQVSSGQFALPTTADDAALSQAAGADDDAPSGRDEETDASFPARPATAGSSLPSMLTAASNKNSGRSQSSGLPQPAHLPLPQQQQLQSQTQLSSYWTWVSRTQERLLGNLSEIRAEMSSLRSSLLMQVKTDAELSRRRLLETVVAEGEGKLVRDAMDTVLIQMQQLLKRRTAQLREEKMQTQMLREWSRRRMLDRRRQPGDGGSDP